MMYRVLHPQEEPSDIILTTNIRSEFRQQVFAYRRHSHAIYIFAQKTGLRLMNAVRVAENIPAFIDLLNDFLQSQESQFDLQQMLICDPVRYISREELYDFTYNYVEIINETGLFYDYSKEHYLWEFIWEIVRNSEFPEMPSRMNSVFLFESVDEARNFKEAYRESDYILANIELIEGETYSFDMNWFSEVPCDVPLSEIKEYVRNYWSQNKTDSPVIEVLFQGKYMWENNTYTHL